MDILLALILGVGLSAAAGFRVFVPLLGMSIAAQAGHLELAAGFGWLSTPTVTIALAIATALEIAAYFIPWLDNALDTTVATPAAVVAGTVMTASRRGDMSPLLRWGLAVIAGGGVAGTVQGATVVARGRSTVTTAGLANPLVALAELAASGVTTVLALAVPLIALVFVASFLIVLGARRRSQPAGGAKEAGNPGRGSSA